MNTGSKDINLNIKSLNIKGKNSTDIYLYFHIVEALLQPPHGSLSILKKSINTCEFTKSTRP